MQLEALIHPFFDELREPNTRLPNGRFLPPLFNFKPHGTNYFKIILFAVFYPSEMADQCLLLLLRLIRTKGRAC